MAYKILLTEQVSDLAVQLASDFEVLTFSLPALGRDRPLQDAKSLSAYFERYNPSLVINTLSGATDLIGIELLGELCQQHNTPLLHVSSVDVFDPGLEGAAALENDSPTASHSRGLALIAAEHTVAQVPRHIILRLPYLTSATHGSWLDQLCRALLHADQLCVSESHRLDPISLQEASRVIVALSQQILCGAENWGILHLHSADTCSEAELADHLVRFFKKSQLATALLDPIKGPSNWLPPRGVLGGQRVTDQFGVQLRSWRNGLRSQVELCLEQQRQGELF